MEPSAHFCPAARSLSIGIDNPLQVMKRESPVPKTGSATQVGSGTTERVLALLGCFGERAEWSVGDLAAHLALPKPTVHRLLTLCKDQGFIAAAGGGVYGVGTEFSRIASQVVAQDDLVRTGTRLIEDMAHSCGEVVILAAAIPQKLSMTYLAKAEPTEDFRYHVELHTPLSLCWGACGRSILAHLPKATVDLAIANGRPSPSGAPFDTAALRRDLQLIRKNGYCVSLGQHKLTAVGVAVPFFGAGGQVRGSIGFSVPTFKFRNKMVRPLSDTLAAACQELTYVLGGEAPGPALN
jgi:DNA-binding IclR family transcriptional regulator